MLNKKRLFIFVVFIFLLFFMTTFASGPIQNQTIATRLVTFIDGFDNSTYNTQVIEVGKDAIVPDSPKHNNYVFVGWYLEDDHNTRVMDFTQILEDLTVVALYEGDLNNNGIADSKDTYYDVTFRDTLNNNVIKTQSVLVGMDATAPLVNLF